MKKYLVIGDPHAVVEELADCRGLISLVCSLVKSERPDVVVFMGDLYNNHNVVRLEVVAFWRQTFDLINSSGCPDIRVLVGNHDYAGHGMTENALMCHKDQVSVVEHEQDDNGCLFLSYKDTDRHEEFVQACQTNAKVLFCHQTFNGAKYENGFYAPDGIDQDLIPQKTIISGHIHTPQDIGKVQYIGAPRWRSLSDANIERFAVMYTIDKGEVLNKQTFPTAGHCRMIRTAVDTQQDPLDGIDSKADWRIDVKGPASWVAERAIKWSEAGARVRQFPNRERVIAVRESEGIGPVFREWIRSFEPKHGTPTSVLSKLSEERLNV
jgi:DNA repair exonuclease SbcCD nuclease subunit